jgi:hypothetical protein
MGPLHVFPIILYNNGLYIYTIRYESSIKITGFLWNFLKIIKNKIKTNLKFFKLISSHRKIKNIFFFQY